MTTTPTNAVGRWQYSLKSLLIVATGVCVWAKLAKFFYDECAAGPAWLHMVFVVWMGALLVQGCLHVWAWLRLRQSHEFPSGRFRVSLFWGAIPLALWLLLCMILFQPRPMAAGSGYLEFLGVTILHMAVPTALLLAGSTLWSKEPFPLKVVRWAIVVSCAVPITAVMAGLAMKVRW